MPTTYEKCSDDVRAIATRLISKFHRHLKDAGVTFQFLYADAGKDRAGEPKPAIKRAGVACSAKVRRMTLQQRAAGNADVEILLDLQVWRDLSDTEKDALMDHELYHVELVGEEDDLGRPKVEMKPHDFEIWGFKAIIERHGMAAIEAKNAKSFIAEYQQMLLWAEDNQKVG